MHVLEFCFYATGAIYAFMCDTRLIYIFLTLLLSYEAFRTLYYPGNNGSIRKRLQLCLWTAPAEGMIYSSVPYDLTNVNKYLESENAKANKVTLTHICLKSMAQGMIAGKDCMNGKIVFGKFIPYKTFDISCLVDVEGGKDLAALLVEDVDKKNLEEIARVFSQRVAKVKSQEDREHQKRVGPFKFMPPFLMVLCLEAVSFVSYGLGLSVAPLAVKKHGFGAATLTSLGAFGFKDVFAPLTPNMRNSFICAINKIVDTPIVKDGKVVIAPVFKLNFTIDHRFLDGSKAKAILVAMSEVFENPEKFAMKQK